MTGFIVDTIDEAIQAVKNLERIDRRKVRARFEQRFTADRMGRAYENHYRQLLRAGGALGLAR
jgi:pyrroloquinoline quinone (PQQ) biosynthesis protein C